MVFYQKIYRLFLAKISNCLRAITGSGLSPNKLAMTICIGVAMGVLPLPWATTLLCFFLAYLFKLNHVVIQSLNYLLYPLQLALLIPYCKLGAWLFPGGPPFFAESFVSIFHKGIFNTLNLLGWTILKAVVAWMVTAPPVALILYLMVIFMVRRKSQRSVESLSA